MIRFFIGVALLNSCVVLGQRGSFAGTTKRPLCVAVGDYCFENRDCCSKFCLGQTQRCIVGTTPEVIDPNSRPASTTNLDNRFDDTQRICQQLNGFCQIGRDCCSGICSTATQKCLYNNEIPNRAPTTTNAVIGSSGLQGQHGIESSGINDDRTCSRVNQQCSKSRNCCAFLSCEKSVCRDVAVVVEGTETFGYNPNNTLDNRFGEDEAEITNTPSNTPCAQIGQKCFKETDCCTGLRCHGFLHKCVT
ncbi:CLUMA_CG002388, isoform A [Clunio marinus]|uniref:CLUMA_CG002388, isoform A n=1 Tax=Clunio marinus TaxID=568069 RepID=A0A1J1HKT8_9DIPT|nr:CLUMA_CG002388, isoform A [Clunio marinus]